MDLFLIVIRLLAVLIALTVHEFAHALIADRLGDPTARMMGRLSLDPRQHWDPVGTTMLFITAIFGPLAFGWAKPVMFDPYNLQNPKRDSALIALAGPGMNFLVAIIASLLLHFFLMEIPILNVFTTIFIATNISLGIFNLIPINPLDGSKILYGILPIDAAEEFNTVMSRYGMIILLFLIIPFNGVSALTQLISPLIAFLLKLLLP